MKLVFFFIIVFVLIGSVSAIPDDADSSIDFSYLTTTNFSTINVNDSIYWDNNLWSDTRWLNIDGSNANSNIDIGVWNFSATHFIGDDLTTTGNITADYFIGDGSFLTGISSVSVGTDNQIPYVNAAGDDFLYDTGLKYEKKDGYLVLDGTDDAVTIPDSAALSPTDDLTVFLWVKGAGQGSVLMSHYDYGASQRAWVMRGGGAGSVYFQIILSDDGSYDAAHVKEWIATDTTLLDNTWNSVAFTFESGTLKMFVDGIEQTTLVKNADDAITTIHDCTKSLVIGNYWNNEPTFGGSWFNGELDNAMVIDRVLTPAEITALHSLGREATYTDANLQGNWKFDDGTADDSTANAGDGILTNGAYITDLSILQIPKIEVNELAIEGGNLTFKRFDEADFLIESLNHDMAAVTLKRTGSAYYDWRIRNEGGNLNFEYSTDDTANWIESLVIQYDATLAYEGLLQVTREDFPVISSIRQKTSYGADPINYWVNSLYTEDTTAPYSENYRGGFVLFNTNSAGEKTAAGFFGSALYDHADGAELGSLKFYPYQAGTTSSGNIAGYFDLRALTSTTGEAVFTDMSVSIASDDTPLTLGAANDASIEYDGTDMVINPKEVGTGSLKVLGDITTTGTGTFGDATIGNGYTGNCINTIFVSGIATGCND